jgi:hypothetical protein
MTTSTRPFERGVLYDSAVTMYVHELARLTAGTTTIERCERMHGIVLGITSALAVGAGGRMSAELAKPILAQIDTDIAVEVDHQLDEINTDEWRPDGHH